MSPIYTLEVDAGMRYGILSTESQHMVVKVTRQGGALRIEPVSQHTSLADAINEQDARNEQEEE